MTKLARALLKPINSATTVLLGVYACLWGLWVLGPWEVYSSASIFDGLRAIAPEWVWGLSAVSVGLLVIYGALRPSYLSLMRGAAASGALWTFIAIELFVGDWHNTGGITYGFIAVYSAFIYLNVKVNHDHGHDWSASE